MAIVCPKCGGKVVGYEDYTHKSMNVYERSKRCKESRGDLSEKENHVYRKSGKRSDYLSAGGS